MRLSLPFTLKLDPRLKKAGSLIGFVFMAVINVAIIYSIYQSENTSNPSIADQYFNHALKVHCINESPLVAIMTVKNLHIYNFSAGTASNVERAGSNFYAFTFYSLLIALLSSISFLDYFLWKKEEQLYTSSVYIPPSF